MTDAAPRPRLDGPAADGDAGSGGETTRRLGDALSGASPEVGTTIGGAGGALDHAIATGAPPIAP